MAFNDYFISNIIIKKDGGFLINTESYYTTSRFGNWNRWNYLYGILTTLMIIIALIRPITAPGGGAAGTIIDQTVRYHADNITILSFDKDGKLAME